MKRVHFAGAMLVASVVIASAQAPSRPATAQASAGRPVAVTFDKAACSRFDLGTIACGSEYLATLSADGKMWSVIGQTKDGAKGIKGDYPAAAGSTINIWGRNYTRRGSDIYIGDVKVGTAR